MAYIEPNTTIKFLVGVPFDPTYENTMYFANAAEQEAWMLNKTLYTFDRNSYQRVSRGRLKVGWVADALGSSVINQLYSSNYMMFKNTNFENKWFYAFVTNVEYVNNNTVEVNYVIDVVQTWLFQFRFNQCLIEREHTTTDVLGENTIPESLEHGPYREDVPTYYMDSQVWSTGQFRYTPAVCLVTTFDAQGQYSPGGIVGGRNYWGDTYSGLHYTFWELTAANVLLINQTLSAIVENAKADGVVALFMCPTEFAAAAVTGGNVAAKILDFGINTTIDGYTPRNKKLFVYPYNMMYVSNNQGNSAEYRWEEFLNPNVISLSIWGNISTNPGMYCKPIAYKGVGGENDEEALSVTGFPMCAWTNDAYKAWVAQNAGTITATLAGVAASWATMLASPIASAVQAYNLTPNGPIGGAWDESFRSSAAFASFGNGMKDASGSQLSGTIAATLASLGQIYDHKRQPPQSHGNGNGNLQFQNDLLTFTFRRKFIKREYAKIIDSFFDMYGYATHRVGLPNLNARPCYSYVKTVGASIDGTLPASVCSELEGIFNKGIRFWKTTAVFGSFDPGVNDNRV